MSDIMTPMPPLAPRSDIEIYRMWEIFKAVNARVKAGGEVVNLLVGEPTLPPPQKATAAAQAALSKGRNLGYTEALGMPALRSQSINQQRRGFRLPLGRSVGRALQCFFQQSLGRSRASGQVLQLNSRRRESRETIEWREPRRGLPLWRYYSEKLPCRLGSELLARLPGGF